MGENQEEGGVDADPISPTEEDSENVGVDIRKDIVRDFIINKMSPAQISEKYGLSTETILNVIKNTTTEPQLAERPSGDMLDPEAIENKDVLRRLAELQSEQEDDELEVATMREKASAAAISEITKETSKETRDAIKNDLVMARALKKRYEVVAAQYGMELEDFINIAVQFYLEHGSDFTAMSDRINDLMIQRDKLAKMLMIKNYKKEVIEDVFAISIMAGQKIKPETMDNLVKIFSKEGM